MSKISRFAKPNDDEDPIKSLKSKCCVKVDISITGLKRIVIMQERSYKKCSMHMQGCLKSLV